MKKYLKQVNWVLSLLVCLSPFLLCAFFMGIESIKHFVPSPCFGDETNYYRVTKSFVEGWHFGNYSVSYYGDVAARFGGLPAHGPRYFILYGILGKIFGWEAYSILLFNIALLCLALLAFILLVKPTIRQNISLLVLMISFFPFLFFLVSGMVETFQYVLILLYIAFAYKLYQTKARRWYWIGMAFVLVMTVFRVTYFPLFFPLILFAHAKRPRRLLLDAGLSLLLTLVSFVVVGWFCAPYPNFLESVIEQLLSFRIGSTVKMVLLHAKEEIKLYFSLHSLPLMHTAFNYLYFTVTLLSIGIGIYRTAKNKRLDLWLICGALLFLELLILFFLYEVQIYKSFRTLSAFLFLPFCLLILQKTKISYAVLAVLFALNLALSNNYQSYQNDALSYISKSALVTDQEAIDALFAHIPYDDSGDRWKNTIATNNSLTYNMEAMFGFPGYAGFNYMLTDDYTQIEKCEYILAGEDSKINLEKYEFVYQSKYGILYRHK